MNKELMEKIRREFSYIGLLLIITVVLFKILFYRGNFLSILRTSVSFFWMFIVPGFSLIYCWHEKLEFIERFIAGVALSAALVGISSYYLGLIGLHIKYHGILLPIIFLVIAMITIWKKEKTE